MTYFIDKVLEKHTTCAPAVPCWMFKRSQYYKRGGVSLVHFLISMNEASTCGGPKR